MDLRRCCWWGEKEAERYNTKRHQVIRREIYKLALLSPKECKEGCNEFKEDNPNLFNIGENEN